MNRTFWVVAAGPLFFLTLFLVREPKVPKPLPPQVAGNFGTAMTWQTIADPDASIRASTSNTIILFSTEWCGVCKYMKAGALQDAAVVEALSAMQRIHVDCDEQKQVCSQFNVDSYPRTMIFDPSGKMLLEIKGGVDAARLLSLTADANLKG